MRRLLLLSTILLACLSFVACGGDSKRETATDQSAQSTSESGAPKIVAFGDSLTAGYGLDEDESYPALLQEMLERDGFEYEVVNAGVSGDTTAGGLTRIDWALEQGDVRFVVLELGANDLLRGLPASQMKKNLSEIIERCEAKGARVLLAGMIAPTNQGRAFQRESAEVFNSLAEEHEVPLIPFFLDRVAGVSELNLEDGVHPNPEGTKIVAETVYRALRPMLEEARAGGD